MVRCGRAGLVWMLVGVLLPGARPQACPRPPCWDRLVASLPRGPGPDAGPGTAVCEGPTGGRGCRTGVPLPAAVTNTPSRLDPRVGGLPQVQPKVAPPAGEAWERVARLQHCMGSPRDSGALWGRRVPKEGTPLGAVLALMAAVLTECDLHCHSRPLQAMARRLEGAAVGRQGEKDLLLLLKSITQHPPLAVPPLARLHPQDCAEIYRRGIVENGFYTIQPALQRPALEAKCDMQTAGGGWTVFQRRQDGSLDFNRTWQAYAEGFGSPPAGELWLGNAALHALTAAGGPHTLRIELEDWRQQRRHAVYSSFRVGPEAQRFRLTAREYSGDAGDALSYSARYNHDGRAFSTADRDHDRYAAGHCARYYGAGWWFDACLAANLNGRYYRGRYGGLTDGIYWGTWHALTDARTGERLSFKTVEMKTRPGPPRG
ncbi:fibroleukin [Gadus morhua]|uniref:fibroleukin n=1 Tax=Gadus morhua TaxID=8049 RepID=UPI0011B49689|nr:fibroleukin-like [Gadus morhua]